MVPKTSLSLFLLMVFLVPKSTALFQTYRGMKTDSQYDVPSQSASTRDVLQAKPGTRWQWQLQGTIDTSNAAPQPVRSTATTECTPCTRSSDCHDVDNVEGLNQACGELSCIAGTCTFEAWVDYGRCASSNFVECAGDDGKCTKGPSGVNYEGTCTGYGNNECIYTWCPATATTECTPCTRSSDCHDVDNVEGLDEVCGELSCIAGTCTFEAWVDYGRCASSNFVECAGDNRKCTKGPSGVNYEGTCTGYGNNECIYTWCPGDQGEAAPLPTAIWQPKPRTTWQWQLEGTINTSFNVDMYDIDLFDVPQSVIDKLHADGRIAVCCFSAGSYENWRPDVGSFSTDLLGSPLGDWNGERWLNIRNIRMLGPIMQARLDLAVSKKCDGVEPDNIDGYRNNNGLGLTYNDQLTYNRWLAAEAHKRGLSIGLKNDLEQVTQLIDDFDWALNEECYKNNECNRLVPFINAGKAVFGVEYEGNPAIFCPELNAKQFSWLKKNLDLDSTVLADCMADY